MKEITISFEPGSVEVDTIRTTRPVEQVVVKGEDIKVSDGYHTFDELYDHRITLFIALCRILRKDADHNGIWRSKLHNDGTMYEGWFIMGIGEEAGNQITYHLPIARWHETDFAAELTRAPKWDGHTPADVLERLKQL